MVKNTIGFDLNTYLAATVNERMQELTLKN